MSRISQIEFRHTHRALVASLGTPTAYVASAGTVRTATAAAMTEAAGYWVGARAHWTSGPNLGLWSLVTAFDSATDTLTFEEELPAAVANTHGFTLYLGGKWASTDRLPALKTPALSAITGCDLVHVAAINGLGTGTLRFRVADETLTWQPAAGTEGSRVFVGALALNGKATVYGGGTTVTERSRFLEVKRTAAALPGSDQTDALSCDYDRSSWIGPITGDQAAAGVTIYAPVAVYNAGTDGVYGVRVYAVDALEGAIASTVAQNLSTGAGTLTGASLSTWGSSGWAWNQTKNDVRYFYERSGNSALVVDPGAGLRGFTAQAWTIGDVISLFPWCDVGLDGPGASNVFEDPLAFAAPSGVAFSVPASGSGLLIGDMAAGALYVVWTRTVVPAGMRPAEALAVGVRCSVGVSTL